DRPLWRRRPSWRAHELEPFEACVVGGLQLVALDTIARGEREGALASGPAEERVEICIRAGRRVAAEREQDVDCERRADRTELTADRQRRVWAERSAYGRARLVVRRRAQADERHVHGRQLFGKVGLGVPVHEAAEAIGERQSSQRYPRRLHRLPVA